MPASNTPASSASAIQEFINIVKTPAYNSCVFWNGNHPGSNRINVSALGPRDVTTPSLNVLQGQETNSAVIVNLLRNHAIYTTVYRRARSGMHRSRGGSRSVLNDRTDICRLNDNYRITYGTISISPGQELSGPVYTARLQALRADYSKAQTTAPVVDLRVCHDSCHSSCHSSRGRR